MAATGVSCHDQDYRRALQSLLSRTDRHHLGLRRRFDAVLPDGRATARRVDENPDCAELASVRSVLRRHLICLLPKLTVAGAAAKCAMGPRRRPSAPSRAALADAPSTNGITVCESSATGVWQHYRMRSYVQSTSGSVWAVASMPSSWRAPSDKMSLSAFQLILYDIYHLNAQNRSLDGRPDRFIYGLGSSFGDFLEMSSWSRVSTQMWRSGGSRRATRCQIETCTRAPRFSGPDPELGYRGHGRASIQIRTGIEELF
jgi:hypothetical protein